MRRTRALVVVAILVLAIAIAAVLLWVRSTDMVDLAMVSCRLCHG